MAQVNDTVMLDLESGKIKDFIKFDVGNLAMCTGGHNNGRVGTIVHKEKHKGSFDIVHIKDAGEGGPGGRRPDACSCGAVTEGRSGGSGKRCCGTQLLLAWEQALPVDRSALLLQSAAAAAAACQPTLPPIPPPIHHPPRSRPHLRHPHDQRVCDRQG